MMLSIILHAQSLRFGIPAFIMVGVSPHYFAGWFTWRLISSILPRRVYERIDEMAYDSYQSLVTYFFETFTGTRLIFYGDELPLDKKENVVYISNHQSAVDWVVTDLIAIRQESLGRIRYVLKNGLKYLPLYGCYFAQHGCIYVKRGGEKNDLKIRRKLQAMAMNKTPFWLVIFPEGTRYDLSKQHVIKASQDFAEQNGLPVLEHLLTPRTRATELSLEELGPHLDAVYDVTIAYLDPKKPVLPKAKGKSLTGDSLSSVNIKFKACCPVTFSK
eukprot:gene7766-13610_t